MDIPFKILTYNVHRGLSAFRRRDICEKVAGILDFSSADVACLQEVWQHEGFDEHQLHDHLCELRWPHRVFAKTVSFRNGNQGNAVVAQLPVDESRLLDISIPRREPRGILYATVHDPSGAPVSVFCVHFGLWARERLMQFTLLETFIARHIDPQMPVIVAGDFNDWRRHLTPFFSKRLGMHEVMLDTLGTHGRTYPSYLPMLSLDRIYYRNCTLQAARIVRERVCLTLSDHLPVEALFLLKRA